MSQPRTVPPRMPHGPSPLAARVREENTTQPRSTEARATAAPWAPAAPSTMAAPRAQKRPSASAAAAPQQRKTSKRQAPRTPRAAEPSPDPAASASGGSEGALAVLSWLETAARELELKAGGAPRWATMRLGGTSGRAVLDVASMLISVPPNYVTEWKRVCRAHLAALLASPRVHGCEMDALRRAHDILAAQPEMLSAAAHSASSVRAALVDILERSAGQEAAFAPENLAFVAHGQVRAARRICVQAGAGCEL